MLRCDPDADRALAGAEHDDATTGACGRDDLTAELVAHHPRPADAASGGLHHDLDGP